MKEYLIEAVAKIIEFLKNIFFLMVHYICWEYYNLKPGLSDSLMCLNGKTAIVTGGNSGIGLMTTKLLASRGCRVIIACRRDAKKQREEIIKETNNPNIIVKHLDLCQLTSIRQFAENIEKEEPKIDILINNAGIAYGNDMITEDGFNMVTQANYIGPFLLTHLLIDLLKAADDARIVFLTSSLAAHSKIRVKDLYPTIPSEPSIRSYADSKLLNILVAQEMARKLEKFKIKVNAADPGVVRTPIFEPLEGSEEMIFLSRLFNILICLFSSDLTKSAYTSFHLAASKHVGSGLLYFRCLPMWKPRILKNETLSREIWDETEKIVKLRPEERL